MRRLVAGAMTAVVVGVLATGPSMSSAHAESYQRISGEGSSWAATAIDAMRVNVKQFGITVDYAATGSSAGRKNFLNGTVDFAASDIPFQFKPEDGSAPEKPAPGSYAYIPVTAGGTTFMYNLKINGQRVTNLRLSGENVSKIFTGVITQWNDPALRADNPGLTLPARRVVPVVRSDGSGSSAQFTDWMIHQHSELWNDHCRKAGRAPACGATSFYPTTKGMIAQSGDVGVAGYVSQGFAEGAIGYVNYSYALNARFPVAKVLNTSGYYTEPTPENVAVSLLKAKINRDEGSDLFLTQQLDGVYTDRDKRSYQLSSYSYFVLPTKVQGQFNEQKGKTLGAFAYYAMCQAQQQSASLGYSPMPINLVEASFDQIRRIPGVVAQDVDVKKCKNPTFSSDGTNLLAKNAPMPKECDKKGASQCADGTGGARAATRTSSAAAAPTSSGSSATSPSATSPAASGRAAAAGGARAPTLSGGSAPAATALGGASGASDTACTPGTEGCDAGAVDDLDAPLGDTGATAHGVAGGELAGATPTLLRGSQGWTATTMLILLIAGLTLGLVLLPPLLWMRVAGPSPLRGGRSEG